MIMQNENYTYQHKRDKYILKLKNTNKKAYRSGGAKSLDHRASEKYIETLANPHDDMNHISVSSHLIDSNFPPQNKRQLDNISTRLTQYFTNVYQASEALNDGNEDNILPLFLLLGFSVNVGATNKQVFGTSCDKHAIVFSLLKIKTSYRLEIFDANGPFVPENYPFDRAILELAKSVAKELSSTEWFATMNGVKKKTIQIRQYNNPNLNFGAGHCDFLAISYIEGRNRYPDDDNVLLDKLTTFAKYPDKKKQQVVTRVTKSIQQNVSIIRKMVPEQFKFPL